MPSFHLKPTLAHKQINLLDIISTGNGKTMPYVFCCTSNIVVVSEIIFDAPVLALVQALDIGHQWNT